jgi:protein arginine kinase activator
MLCQICQKNKATIHLKEVISGTVKEIHACEACAETEGVELQSASLTDFLLGLGMQPNEPDIPPAQDTVCKGCQMRLSDFRKTSRLGCPECYETYTTEIAPMLTAFHKGGLKHTGRTPAHTPSIEELAVLQESLKEAIVAQNFEEAARLRDLLRDITVEAKSAGGKKAGTPCGS